MLKKIFLTICLLVIMMPGLAVAQDNSEPVDGAQDIPAETYYKAQVLEILNQEYLGSGADKQIFQDLKIKILTGDEKNQEIILGRVGGANLNGGQGFKVGNVVVVNKTTAQGETNYYINDIYRIPSLIWITIIFLVVTLALSRWRGLASLLGLAISIVVILKFVAPQILAGKNPLLICVLGAVAIALTSLYLAHGFNKRTSVALLGTLLTLGLSVGLAALFVYLTNLFGNGSEESVYLQFVGPTGNISLHGLLLGGIILGALGVLDDITTAQAATVDELKKANPSLGFKQLYTSASSVGQEHISSLINTLFLAYAGAGLPLFLLLAVNNSTPVWVTLNAEVIAEEIVRTLVGSITLMVAVPITTLLAAYFFSKTGPSKSTEHAHTH